MNTTNKLAEALTLGLECAYELLAEKRQALAGHPEKVAPYQEMADYLRRELAAHEQAQAGEPVAPYLYVYEYDSPFGLNREFYPSGWNGQKPTRTVPLYTTPPAPQPAPVDERAAFEQWVEVNVAQHHDKSDRHCMWWGWQARAALQSPAPQTKDQP